MEINSVSRQSFGEAYPCIVKKLFKAGAFGDKVSRGFYGDILTVRNVSVEHLKPFSQSHRSDLSNLVLATRKKNHQRGTKPLRIFINIPMAFEYLEQFRDIIIPGKFNGNDYIRMVTRRLRDMGIILSPKGWERRVKARPQMTIAGRQYR